MAEAKGFEKVGVVGAGTMGNGIAQVFAAHGSSVVLVDVVEEALQRGLAHVEKSLGRFVAKEKLTEGQALAMRSSNVSGVIRTTPSLSGPDRFPTPVPAKSAT